MNSQFNEQSFVIFFIVDARISAYEKDLPVQTFSYMYSERVKFQIKKYLLGFVPFVFCWTFFECGMKFEKCNP